MRHLAAHRTAPQTARPGAIDVEVAITIRRPRADVAAVMFDPRYDAAWVGGLRRSAADGPVPLRSGMTVTRDWRWFRCGSVDVSKVVQHTPGRVLELATQLPCALRIRYELEGIPEGAIARIRVDGSARGALRLVAALANPLLRLAVVRNLDRLKALLESGAWRHLGV